MKSKGITIWEQHVEKMVLGVAVLLFVGFTAMQFIGNPNAAKIGNETVAPADVDAKLEEKARAIQAKQSQEAASIFELSKVDPVAGQLQAALDDSISPAPTLALATYNLVPKVGEGIIEAKPYHIPTINWPEVVAKQYEDALLPEVVEMPTGENIPEHVVAMHTQLMSLFPSGKPYDLTYVTVFGEFDLAALRDEFLKKSTDLAQIPPSWYASIPKIVDIVIERGELVDGRLTNVVTINPLPGQYTFRSKEFLEAPDALTVRDRNYMLDELLKPIVEQEITQPEFYATRRGSWQPLTVGELDQQEIIDETMDEGQAEIARLDRIIRSKKAERDRIAARLEELGGPLAEGEDSDSSGGSSGSGDAPGPGKGGGLQGAPGMTGTNDRTKRQRIELAKKLDQLDKLIASKEAERAQLAGASTVEAIVEEGPQDKVMIWGHDIAVEPGKTYQYRMTVKVFNPFFGRKLSLVESQQRVADSITLDSEPSPWSEPMYVEPPVQMFVTSAKAGSQGSMGMSSAFGQASIEVFRFYDGLTWSETFSVQPGDRVGAMRDVTIRSADGSKKFPVDFRTDYLVVDIIENLDVESSRGGIDTGGMAARVVLMNLKTGEITELRDPAVDRFSATREELKEEVDISEQAALSS